MDPSKESQDSLDSSTKQSTWRRMKEDVDSKKTIWIMLWACFLTGFTSAVTFSACYIWCGFQTGGVAQLGLAVARTFAPASTRTYIFEKPDQQALVSLLSFLLGTSIGRIGDRIGPKTKLWLVLGTLIQAVLVAAAAIAVHFAGEPAVASSRGDPSWNSATAMVALAFASASLGLQGIIGKRLNTQLATCVVLTTVWVEICNDPLLLALKPVATRDHKAGGVFCLFVGAILGRACLEYIGSAWTFGIVALVRAIGAGAWLLI